MKRLLSVLLLSFIAASSFSQELDKNNKNNLIADKIQNEKIAYFTKELDLTLEEAQVFWPIYFQYQKEADDAHQATMKALWEATAITKKGDATEAEIDKILTAYNKAMKDEAAIPDKYYSKYKKILPASKIAKLYLAEESFKLVILNKFRKPADNATQWNPGFRRQIFGNKSQTK